MIPKGNNSFDGYCIDLLHEIQGVLKFDYELYPSPDGLVGSMDDQGQWNGVVKELMEKVSESYLEKQALQNVLSLSPNNLYFTVNCIINSNTDIFTRCFHIYINK